MLSSEGCLKYWEYCETLDKDSLQKDLDTYLKAVKEYSRKANLAVKRGDYSLAEANFLLCTQWMQKSRLIKRAIETK